MPKYKLKLEKYTLPDAIKKYNDKIRLKESNIQKDEIENKLKELNDKYDKNEVWSDDDKKQKTKLLSKLSKVNNTIYEIKAELNNSTVNFNNANIKELNTNISDISSLINNNKQFNSIIGQQISDLLTSQLKLNDIFETENFKEMLKDIVDEVSKTQNKEVKDKIEEVIQEINDNNNNANENYQTWVAIRDEIKKAIPDNLQNIIKKYGDDIKKINELKTELYNVIFKKDVDNVDENEVDEYSFKVMLLANLYDLVKEELLDKYFNMDSGQFQTAFHFKVEDAYPIIDNIRKWFMSDDDYEKFQKSTFNTKIISNIIISKILSNDFVKNINPVDISKAIDLIKNNIKVYKKGPKKVYISNEPYIPKEKNKTKQDSTVVSQEQNTAKGLSKQSFSGDLDLDEIQFWRSLSSTNINIMNNIIQSLDNIIYNQNRIIELLSKQNISKQNISEKSLQKLGRFKVEKYKPNMSITEFKKLFSKLD